jgi:hypothetical protein
MRGPLCPRPPDESRERAVATAEVFSREVVHERGSDGRPERLAESEDDLAEAHHRHRGQRPHCERRGRKQTRRPPEDLRSPMSSELV